MSKDGEPVGKVMVGRLAKDFGQCHCTQKYAGLTSVDWSETAFYNEVLAVSIVRGALDHLRSLLSLVQQSSSVKPLYPAAFLDTAIASASEKSKRSYLGATQNPKQHKA